MARPQKQNVDYFPHDSGASHGRTLYIIENLYGNDGYAFWFKLLELVSSGDNLVYDAGNPSSWQYLLAKTRVDGETAEKILKLLCELEAIDTDLYLGHRLIWSDNLLERVTDVFIKRTGPIPIKPVTDNINRVSDNINVVSDSRSTQSKVKETKSNKTILKEPLPADKKILMIWKEVTGFKDKMTMPKALELLDKLKADHPGLDIEKASQEWAAYKIGKPLMANSNPASQLYKWMANAEKFEKERQDNETRRKPGGTKDQHGPMEPSRVGVFGAVPRHTSGD